MKHEMNAKNKKIALLGFVIFIIVAAVVFVGGSLLRTNGNLEADGNTAIGALKAQIVGLKVRPKTIDLTVKESYAMSTDTDVKLTFASIEDYGKVFSTSSEEGENQDLSKSLKAESVVYFTYEAMEYEGLDNKTNGEKLGGDKFLAFVCEGDIIVVINNELNDGTVVTASEEGLRSAIVKYPNTGIAEVTYVSLTEDNSPLVKYPEDFSSWYALDPAGLTDLIAIDSIG